MSRTARNHLKWTLYSDRVCICDTYINYLQQCNKSIQTLAPPDGFPLTFPLPPEGLKHEVETSAKKARELSLGVNYNSDFTLFYIDRRIIAFIQIGDAQLAVQMDDGSISLLTQFPQSNYRGIVHLSDAEIEASVRILRATQAIKKYAVVGGWRATVEKQNEFMNFLQDLFRTSNQAEIDLLISDKSVPHPLDILVFPIDTVSPDVEVGL